jgi:hypothetical protein
MRRSVQILALLIGLGSASAAEVPAGTPSATMPDTLATSWAQALKRNDLSGAYALFTAADQQSLANHWQRQMARPDPYTDVQIDTLLRLAQNSTATEQLLAMSQPYLAQIDIPRLTKGITDIASFLGNAADLQPNAATGGLDYAGLRDWLKDLATWVPTAGFTDQNKARLAAGHLVRALAASGVQSAAELRAMPLPVLLVKAGAALPALKEALAVYNVRVDAALDSFTAKLGAVEPEQVFVTLGFTSLGKPRTITLRLVQKNGAWQLASGNDNPLTSLSQLVMMAMLMQGMGGEPATPPAKPVRAPDDDGAL